MDEAKDLKAGMTVTYKIGGRMVNLKPVTLGRMKKAMGAFTGGAADPFDAMQDYLVEILADANRFADKTWIADNVTLPDATRMIEDSRKINGMGEGGFFQPGATRLAEPREMRDLTEETPTPSV